MKETNLAVGEKQIQWVSLNSKNIMALLDMPMHDLMSSWKGSRKSYLDFVHDHIFFALCLC